MTPKVYFGSCISIFFDSTLAKLTSKTEKAVAPRSSPLAWKIPWIFLGKYSYLGQDREVWWAAVYGVATSRTRLNDVTFSFHFHALEKEMATHSSVFAWRLPRTGEPGGLLSMGSHRVGHD